MSYQIHTKDREKGGSFQRKFIIKIGVSYHINKNVYILFLCSHTICNNIFTWYVTIMELTISILWSNYKHLWNFHACLQVKPNIMGLLYCFLASMSICYFLYIIELKWSCSLALLLKLHDSLVLVVLEILHLILDLKRHYWSETHNMASKIYIQSIMFG